MFGNDLAEKISSDKRGGDNIFSNKLGGKCVGGEFMTSILDVGESGKPGYEKFIEGQEDIEDPTPVLGETVHNLQPGLVDAIYPYAKFSVCAREVAEFVGEDGFKLLGRE
jgi:hypothetical protein